MVEPWRGRAVLVDAHDRGIDRRDPVKVPALMRERLDPLQHPSPDPGLSPPPVEVLVDRVQFPNRSGTSRHGAPVRTRHAVAATTVRRSTGGLPVDFPFGNNGPIADRAASEITSRDTTQDWPATRQNGFSNTP